MNPYIIGIGSTKFGELWEYGLRELISYASINALRYANLEVKDIDSLFVANCFAKNIHSICSDELGINSVSNSISISGESSGAYAIIQAANSIAAGSKIALVVGVEKMSDFTLREITKAISELTGESEASAGATLASLYAMITLRHIKQYGTTTEQIDMVSVKNHANAFENEIAQFRHKITKDDIRKSPIIAEPIRLLNSASQCDGCCALVISNEEIARNYTNKIRIIASGIGSDFLALNEREDITTFNAVKSASKMAFEKAGINIGDISFAELHDSFSIAEIISIEDIGFAKKGSGGKFIEDKTADLDGKIPINPSGGLKGCGHPFAATGVRQAIECFYQLNNLAGKRQVRNAKYGLTSALSGTGASAVVNIFSN